MWTRLKRKRNKPSNIAYARGHRLVQIPFSRHRLVQHRQISCLICLPDKSGNFLAFGAKTRKNTVKSEKTGFGMVITARPRPVFCVFRPKIPCTFYFKLTEQSSREKLAAGGFEPEKVQPPYPAPQKTSLLSTMIKVRFLQYFMQNERKSSKIRVNQGLEAV